MIFGSDNWAGASDKVLDALRAANAGLTPAYGGDAITARLTQRLGDIFEREVAVVLVTTGTAANALSIAAFSPPWGSVIAHTEGHLGVDECGAPEFFSGNKIIGVAGPDGKLDAGSIAEGLAHGIRGFVHHCQPSVISISNATELGTVYRPAEIAALAEIAAREGMTLHMDGARFANAVAAGDASPAELTWKSGVNVLSFGATKGGCLMAEAVILFDPGKAEAMGYLRKRAAQLVSKHRFLSAQFDAWLEGDHWLDLARHANAMAKRLADGIRATGCGRLAIEPQANEVFVVLPTALADRLQAAGATFYAWPARSFAGLVPAPEEGVYRLVTSFATQPDEVDRFIALLGE